MSVLRHRKEREAVAKAADQARTVAARTPAAKVCATARGQACNLDAKKRSRHAVCRSRPGRLTGSVSPLVPPARGRDAGGMTTAVTLPVAEVARRIRTDHDVLLRRLDGRSPSELAAEYTLESGPLGDFCESLHDLLGHVLMWDEIGLSVLTEHRAGRDHWSVDPRWETPDAGRRLNRAGVLAGRELPASLLLHRLVNVRDALLTEIQRYPEPEWQAAGAVGTLAQHAMTVPGRPPFVHAALHLDELGWLTR
jgi:hypothetical protein